MYVKSVFKSSSSSAPSVMTYYYYSYKYMENFFKNRSMTTLIRRFGAYVESIMTFEEMRALGD